MSSDDKNEHTGAASINNADELMRKHCSRCEQYKPLEEFFNYRRSSDGKYCWCKDCYKQYTAENAERISERREAYNADPGNKARHGETQAKYYKEHQDQYKAYNQQYHADNAERIKEQKRQDYAENAEQRRAEALERYTANREANLVRMRKYREENADAINERRRAAAARKRAEKAATHQASMPESDDKQN